jgi:hypothetical protein
MTPTFTRIILAAGLLSLGAALAAVPVQAEELSGGASGGGAIQGGSGAPGSGVGIPGSLQNGTSVWGIGEHSTYDVAPAIAPLAATEPTRYRTEYPIRHRHHRHPRDAR